MGVFAEPAGAAPYAGLKKILREGRIERSSTVVIVVTGNGLKDIRALEKRFEMKPLPPDERVVLSFVEKIL